MAESLNFETIECGQNLLLDAAELKISLPSEDYSLYAVNDNCFECKKLLVHSGTSEACAQFFTPHEWTLKLFQDDSHLDNHDYLFGMHGRYELEVKSDKIHIHEEDAPIDGIKPLYVALALLITATVVYIILDYFKDVILSTLGYGKDEDEQFSDVKEGLRSSGGGSHPLSSGLLDETPGSMIPEGESGVTASESSPSSDSNMKGRLVSLDTFRGLTLTMMIFVNYGGGGYWFFEHSDWNGLTVADVLFPWFIFMMGVSMHLSFRSMAKRNLSSTEIWAKVLLRTAKLLALGLFLNNGYDSKTWRLPGVLQYFAVAYLINSAISILCSGMVRRALATLKREIEQDGANPHLIFESNADDPDAATSDRGFFARLPIGDREMFCYWPEFAVQALILTLYMTISLAGKADGCPRGYLGPGGWGDHGDHPDCTGGVHRAIDVYLFGHAHIYDEPTCKRLYNCTSYDPEGALGSLTAVMVTYFGLLIGRSLAHYKTHTERLARWVSIGLLLCLIAGGLCSFSQNDGPVPINKNLWSTSFGLLAAGLGMLGLSMCYALCDLMKWWSGAPFKFMGMNSILLYCSHDVFSGYLPFSYKVTGQNHQGLLECTLLGTICWVCLSYYFHRSQFYWKL